MHAGENLYGCARHSDHHLIAMGFQSCCKKKWNVPSFKKNQDPALGLTKIVAKHDREVEKCRTL